MWKLIPNFTASTSKLRCMKSTFLTLLFFLSGALFTFGQQPLIRCGNELFQTIVQTHHPDLADGFKSTFEAAQNTSFRGQEPLIVNVVVHVVWKENAENLHDSIILNQIRILNDDFNRLNADSAQLRNVFKPEAGAANIQFVLADIIRVQTNVLFDVDLLGTNLLPEVKYNSSGGSDAYDTEQYLNIWICKIQPITIFGIEIGQILGFAFPPNNLSNWPEDSGAPTPDEDGVVIDFRVVGSNNPNPITIAGGGGNLVVKGRTPVHEVGHYFGLRHIWGDGGLLGPNDCAQSDGINDTPYANAQSAFDCDTIKNTCSQIETHYGVDVPDMVENYMDYASEECMTMFTNGQATHMRSVLQGPRSGLLMPFTGVEQLPVASSFSIFPNPGNGRFDIILSAAEDLPHTIRVMNLYGQPLKLVSAPVWNEGRSHIVLDKYEFSGGLYVVELRFNHGTSSKLLMIQ